MRKFYTTNNICEKIILISNYNVFFFFEKGAVRLFRLERGTKVVSDVRPGGGV